MIEESDIVTDRHSERRTTTDDREPLLIDGAQGEGGGQILRSSLALSLVTGRPFQLTNIRAGRRKPGVMRQHLTAIQAAVDIGGETAVPIQIGARDLTFVPRPVAPGEYRFRVGTAGSATLVLQTVLPALLLAQGPSTVQLEGGTHNPWAPPFDFIQQAFLSLVNRIGPQVSATLQRPGFYPAGGGQFTVDIQPAARLGRLWLMERGDLQQRDVRALLSALPEQIGQREIDTVIQKLGWSNDQGRVETLAGYGPGNVLVARLQYAEVSEVFTGFGRVGTSAEKVAKEVVRDIRNYLRATAPVGPYLADQLLLPLAIAAWQANRSNRPEQPAIGFRTVPLTRHSRTHIDLLTRFLGIDIQVVANEDGSVTVTLH